VKQLWFDATKFSAADWVSIKVPSMWAENEGVGELTGYGWYRVPFTVPANWPDKGVRLLFGAIDEQAWVYVNGKQVGEHSEKSENKKFTEIWEAAFSVDVPKELLKKGEPNFLYVRVHNQLAAGGIWRPVNVIPTP
jgi:beta-galactosidase/beta-glucuronidase